VGEVIAFLRSASAEVAPVASLVVPPELAAGFEPVLEASASAQALDSAEAAVAAGDLVAAERLVVRHIGHLRSITGRLGLMGARCGNVDPARVATADLTVPLDLGAEHINVGYGRCGSVRRPATTSCASIPRRARCGRRSTSVSSPSSCNGRRAHVGPDG
jgi:hypothetical protein